MLKKIVTISLLLLTITGCKKTLSDVVDDQTLIDYLDGRWNCEYKGKGHQEVFFLLKFNKEEASIFYVEFVNYLSLITPSDLVPEKVTLPIKIENNIIWAKFEDQKEHTQLFEIVNRESEDTMFMKPLRESLEHDMSIIYRDAGHIFDMEFKKYTD